MVKTINCGGATLVYGFHISIECAEGLHFSAFHLKVNQYTCKLYETCTYVFLNRVVSIIRRLTVLECGVRNCQG